MFGFGSNVEAVDVLTFKTINGIDITIFIDGPSLIKFSYEDYCKIYVGETDTTFLLSEEEYYRALNQYHEYKELSDKIKRIESRFDNIKKIIYEAGNNSVHVLEEGCVWAAYHWMPADKAKQLFNKFNAYKKSKEKIKYIEESFDNGRKISSISFLQRLNSEILVIIDENGFEHHFSDITKDDIEKLTDKVNSYKKQEELDERVCKEYREGFSHLPPHLVPGMWACGISKKVYYKLYSEYLKKNPGKFCGMAAELISTDDIGEKEGVDYIVINDIKIYKDDSVDISPVVAIFLSNTVKNALKIHDKMVEELIEKPEVSIEDIKESFIKNSLHSNPVRSIKIKSAIINKLEESEHLKENIDNLKIEIESLEKQVAGKDAVIHYNDKYIEKLEEKLEEKENYIEELCDNQGLLRVIEAKNKEIEYLKGKINFLETKHENFEIKNSEYLIFIYKGELVKIIYSSIWLYEIGIENKEVRIYFTDADNNHLSTFIFDSIDPIRTLAKMLAENV